MRIGYLADIDEDFPLFNKINILSEAISDWDEHIIILEDQISAWRNYLGGSLYLCKDEILKKLDHKDCVTDAWKAESIFSLLGILDNDRQQLQNELDMLIFRISTYHKFSKSDSNYDDGRTLDL